MKTIEAKRKMIFKIFILAMVFYIYKSLYWWIELLHSPLLIPVYLIFIFFCIKYSFDILFYIARQMATKQIGRYDFLVLFINSLILAFMISMPYFPSNPEVEFRLNRDKFKDLNSNLISDYKKTNNLYIPNSKLYQKVYIYSTNKDSIIVEYIIDDFYLPLVYVSNDNAKEIDDTCSNGGTVLSKIEAYWYVCSRDWN